MYCRIILGHGLAGLIGFVFYLNVGADTHVGGQKAEEGNLGGDLLEGVIVMYVKRRGLEGIKGKVEMGSG